MNIIVVGCGRVGSHLATLLSEDGHNVSVIDRNADSFKNLGRDFNGRIVRGIGFDESALLDAGIDEADVIAAVTSNDNANLMIAEVARRIYEVPHVISRLYEARREKTYDARRRGDILEDPVGPWSSHRHFWQLRACALRLQLRR